MIAQEELSLTLVILAPKMIAREELSLTLAISAQKNDCSGGALSHTVGHVHSAYISADD